MKALITLVVHLLTSSLRLRGLLDPLRLSCLVQPGGLGHTNGFHQGCGHVCCRMVLMGHVQALRDLRDLIFVLALKHKYKIVFTAIVWLYIWLWGRVNVVFLVCHASVFFVKSKELTFKLFQVLVKFSFLPGDIKINIWLDCEEWRIQTEKRAITKPFVCFPKEFLCLGFFLCLKVLTKDFPVWRRRLCSQPLW